MIVFTRFGADGPPVLEWDVTIISTVHSKTVAHRFGVRREPGLTEEPHMRGGALVVHRTGTKQVEA